jgi:hypothetical protein
MAGKGKAAKGKPGAKAAKAKSTPKGKPAKPEPAKRSAAKKGGAPKKTTALAIPSGDPIAAAEKFERDLLIRGDAARREEGHPLPLDATHEIVEEAEGERPKIERRRFKLW